MITRALIAALLVAGCAADEPPALGEQSTSLTARGTACTVRADRNGDGIPDCFPLDADGDGVRDADDCAPQDASIFRGAPERCNGVDDDCDGQTDEAFPRLGARCDGRDADRCEYGRVVCAPGGRDYACDEPPVDTTERCNGRDDDCDGQTDEGYVQVGAPCDGPDVDSCSDGRVACAPGGDRTRCVPNAPVCADPGDACLLDAACHAVPLTASVVILFVGDGMGFEQLRATRMFADGDQLPLTFETLPHAGSVRHDNAFGGTTDSAASATALATGYKVGNGVISRGLPGGGQDLPTALEIAQRLGRRAGLVTHKTPIPDATPAAFGAHAADRADKAEIVASYLNDTRPNVLFGRLGYTMTSAKAAAAGYTVVNDGAGLASLDLASETHVAALFVAGDEPPLAAITTAALDLLEDEPRGFFLLVETEQTDSRGHANDLNGVIKGVQQLDAAVAAALAWAGDRDDVVIIVTADHETGGLTVVDDTPTAGVVPAHTFSTGGHTKTAVPIFGTGPGTDAIHEGMQNTDIFALLVPFAEVRRELVGASGAGAMVGVAEATPDLAQPATEPLTIDTDTPSLSGMASQVLVRFDDVFGATTGGQVPRSALIVSATLELFVSGGGDPVALHALRTPFDVDATWTGVGGGVRADGVSAVYVPDAVSGPVASGGTSRLALDVTERVRKWQLGLPNLGWVLLPSGIDGVDIDGPMGAVPPQLVIRYATP